MSGVQVHGRTVFNNSDINTPDIDGGSADGLVIGGSVPAAGNFTNVDLTGQLQGAVLNNLNSFAFGERVLSMMTDPRLLNVMCEDPSVGGASYIDISGKGHDGTPTGTWASADRVKQGRGWVLSPNGTDTYIDLGDDDDFSFGDGSNDSPFTVIALVEVVRTAEFQQLLSKYDSTVGNTKKEYIHTILTDGTLRLWIGDDSAAVSCNSITDNAMSVGLHLCVSTYSGIGGATAGNGITQYVDGVEVASTITNNGSYVAMENTTTGLLFGASKGNFTSPERFLKGPLGLVGLDAVEWSAHDVHMLWQKVLAQYSTNGIDLS